MVTRDVVVSFILALSCCCCFTLTRFAESKLPQAEVDALQQITTTMGAKHWEFNNDGDSCQVEMVTQQAPQESEARVDCECGIDNSTFCHVVRMYSILVLLFHAIILCGIHISNHSFCHVTTSVYLSNLIGALKFLNLPGVLPPELVNLPYLREIDFAYNYLSGPIPLEWVSTRLNLISLLGNRISGEIPKELGNLTTLTYLDLEANQLMGNVPPELGKLINLRTLMLSSNKLIGTLPMTFAGLRNLTNFRTNDNNFTGPIPDFIQNWKQLTRLEMHASGLEGPIPSSISLLDQLTELRISDIKGPIRGFPTLSNATGIVRLVLRNCNISGEIPAYIWNLRNLEMLDLSFNSDLSYNNFTWQGPEQPTCRQNMNLYINLFKSSSMENNLKGLLPCTKDFSCPRYGCSLHVNSGGNDLEVKESNREVLYEGDGEVDGGSSRYYLSDNSWGFSSTGDFMDDDNYQNTRFIENVPSSNISELYSTARLSPLSLTYFRYCLENGSYNVSLHFAEIQFRNDSTYSSLGRRVFDIYIQEELVWKDFNIEDEAHGPQRPVVEHFNVSVTNNIIEIRFSWGGKGTTRIPGRGVYGPLVSAISVNPNGKKKRKNVTVYVVVGVLALFIVASIIVILWWRGCFKGRKRKGKDFEGLELQTVSFTLKQIKVATSNFDSTNKVGEGGFGPVYKGSLSDGTVIAVKQLSSRSRQGNREFLNEIGMISCLQHPNLVKLHGCCIEGDQLLLVYEYMENNSLANALFASQNSQLILDWPTRFRICIGIAKGLAFLHEESRIKIVHRDIKATNVLLDRDLNPKISDFGLARLNEDENTHISTRIAGTIGYMAPEYALWGYLSDKADVYSFGVVALEIVSGKNNNNYMPSNNCICLLDWACNLQKDGNLEELLDERLGSKVNKEEAEKMVKIALLCTNASPSLRPIMSEVVNMLEGKISIPEIIPEPSTYTEDLRFKAMRDFHREKQSLTSSRSQMQNSTQMETDIGSAFTCTTDDAYEISPNTRSY
ncbi:hypothetical protein LguiB_004770 [Lonicera macranthoides]